MDMLSVPNRRTGRVVNGDRFVCVVFVCLVALTDVNKIPIFRYDILNYCLVKDKCACIL